MRRWIGWCAALVLCWAGTVSAAPMVCKDCVSALSTVKNAAGVDPKLRADWGRAVRGLHFEGEALVAGAPVAEVAAPFVGSERGPLRLAVRADKGLSKAAAGTQAQARAAALRKALLAAGVPASRVKVSAQAR